MKELKDFLISAIQEKFINGKDIEKGNLGHNFGSSFKSRYDGAYVALCLILKYFKPGFDNYNVRQLIGWINQKELTKPPVDFINGDLYWNLYYWFKTYKNEQLDKTFL